MTKQDYAKLLAHISVSATTGHALRQMVVNARGGNPAGLALWIATAFVGEIVAMQLDKYTDDIVERLARWADTQKTKNAK